MNITPKPNTSSFFADGAGVAAALAVSVDAATILGVDGFATGLLAGFAATAAAVFLGAAAFFGAAEEVAFLAAGADLLVVLTVLALSVSEEVTGALDCSGVLATDRGFASAPGFVDADGDGAADEADFFGFFTAADADFFDAGDATGLVGLGASLCFKDGVAGCAAVLFATDAFTGSAVFSEPDVEASDGGFVASATGFSGVAAGDADEEADAALAITSDFETAGFASACFAAASISDDVITTRFTAPSDATAGFETDVDFLALPDAAGAALAAAETFLPDLAEVFCFETAIASNLVLAGADAPNSCCIAT
ncbi:hypothetical protein [Thalassospira povalilytica]|uniref:hypothetical protein n=1 Tax=Thalassospira povalilytica TaxID=732237 RepID=UPI003AA8ECEF